MPKRNNLRNVAIIAHVDHGKTTLVDALFRQGGVYRANQGQVERAMDSQDQERERGITISAKSTSVTYGDLHLQIVDTPGHADFGGEVERTLNLVDGVILLVDAAEGPLPQTRFVLRKALAKELKIVVVINKIDRSDARPAEVLDEIYELFLDLDARDDQIEFPVLYAIARDGVASTDPAELGEDLKPLVSAIQETIPAPDDLSEEPFRLRVNSLAYDPYLGRLVVGRVDRGRVKTNAQVVRIGAEGNAKGKVAGLFRFRALEREEIKEAACGDIVALAGFDEIGIGDTLCEPEHLDPLPRIKVDEPTVAMVFQINDGPFSGKSGAKFLTSRQLRDRLYREAYANVSIRVQDTETSDAFRVLGRGELQLAVLIESLRREGYELCVRNPEVVTREGEDGVEEPRERLSVDVPVEYIGTVSELVGRRKGILIDQKQEGDRVRMEYSIPTRGLFGFRGVLLTSTRGTAIASSVFEDWVTWMGDMQQRANGALVADRPGSCTPYALFYLQPRGELFVGAGTEVYEGMVIGEHARDNDLNVNAVREKKLTNVRASGKDDATVLSPPRRMPLEACLEWIRDDEMVEVTPDAIRIRKRVLPANQRK